MKDLPDSSNLFSKIDRQLIIFLHLKSWAAALPTYLSNHFFLNDDHSGIFLQADSPYGVLGFTTIINYS